MFDSIPSHVVVESLPHRVVLYRLDRQMTRRSRLEQGLGYWRSVSVALSRIIIFKSVHIRSHLGFEMMVIFLESGL